MKKAIYAGSFDPIHEGHVNIANKALKIFDTLYVVVANNPEKNNSSLESRFETVKKQFIKNKKIKVYKLQEKNLLADFAKKIKINFLVRSARNDSDFNFELMMALQNKKINDELETILIMPDEAKIKIRSGLLPKKNN